MEVLSIKVRVLFFMIKGQRMSDPDFGLMRHQEHHVVKQLTAFWPGYGRKRLLCFFFTKEDVAAPSNFKAPVGAGSNTAASYRSPLRFRKPLRTLRIQD